MLPWETMTIVALWETVATMPPSWFIPFMPQWQAISQSTSMMNCFTHSTHDEPFHPCYKWQTISPILPVTNHCTNVIYEKSTVPCCYKKPLQSCHQHKPFHPSYPWQIGLHFAIHKTTCFSHSTHEKNIIPMSPWQTIATMPSWETLSPIQPFHQFYHGKLLRPCHSWPTISHLPSLKTMGPIPPGQTISPILSTTYHLSETKKVFHPPYVSLQRRDISRSLLFWQWLRSCRYRFVSPSPLTFLRITQHCI